MVVNFLQTLSLHVWPKFTFSQPCPYKSGRKLLSARVTNFTKKIASMLIRTAGQAALLSGLLLVVGRWLDVAGGLVAGSRRRGSVPRGLDNNATCPAVRI